MAIGSKQVSLVDCPTILTALGQENQDNARANSTSPLCSAAEDKACSQRDLDLLYDWEQNKPLVGNIRPEQAMETLQKFEFSMKKA